MKTFQKSGLIQFTLTALLISGISCTDDDDDMNGAPTDADGNVYTTITIGDQEWLGKNLKTTSLNDGTPVPEVTDIVEWSDLETSGLSWYENDETRYKDVYGALYNWYTVDTRKLCPAGWHVPTADEWETLHDYLGDSVASKLKEVGNTHWSMQNNDAINSTGFTALP
ncbi:MAG: fibrobacter succinogenes major paralogous domain-containing protein, partial [Cyclobacteriaceae bacterium]|nr:fibrobacter succinogenes major paralogous domain-containing protein [Cyclobacteriaceae bacterium]